MKRKTYLKPDQRAELARKAASGDYDTADLAREYDVSPSTVYKAAAEFAENGGKVDFAAGDEAMFQIGNLVGLAREKARAVGMELDVVLRRRKN